MTTIAIGLDSADPNLIEEMMDAGALPVLENLRKAGAYGRLENFDIFTAELPWTTFATGVTPDQTGYWSPLRYTPDYQIHTRAAYEYDQYPPFFALGADRRVCCFDVPQVRLHKDFNGLQFNAWGAHSPQVDQESNVPDVYSQLVSKFGRHPALHNDYAQALDTKNTRRVYDRLMSGIKKRARVCRDLLTKERWDLFLTVFGETHGGGHNLWQFEPDHPLHRESIPGRELLPQRPMWNILQAVDRALGEILESAPQDANVLIFSPHGMGPSTCDLASMVFLPELMYRWSFGKSALGNVKRDRGFITQLEGGDWCRHVWNTTKHGNVLTKLARRFLPSRVYNPLAPWLEVPAELYPMDPVRAEARFPDIPAWQPPMWYRDCWPKMRAFALPSFSEGYIRLNVAGREQDGLIEPSDFQAVTEEICEELKQLTCARTGVQMVKEVVVTRKSSAFESGNLPDADIVISWQESFATDKVTHPKFGEIGPIPHYRGGNHRSGGFMFMAGDQIPSAGWINKGHALDIAPTILAAIGVQAPSYMKGKCLKAIDKNVQTEEVR